MVKKAGECFIMKEMAHIEEDIKTAYQRVDELEQKLTEHVMPEESNTNIRTELIEVRKLLSDNEERLAELRKANRKSFMFVVALCFVIFAVYMIYILIEGSEF